MQDAASRLGSLERRLDNIDMTLRRHRDHQDSMTPGGRALLGRAEVLLNYSRQALKYRWDRAAAMDTGEQESERRKVCEDFAAVLKELVRTLLPALDGAVSHRIPVEFEPVLQRLAEQTAPAADARVVLYAVDALNYSIERHADPVDGLLRLLAPAMSVRRDDGPEQPDDGVTFLFLRMPAVERDSACLHTMLLGHELGHYRDVAYGLSKPAADDARQRPPGRWCDDTGTPALEHVASYERYAFLVRKWTREIAADTAACLTFGPAALCALGELVGTLGGWGRDSHTHPAPDRRAALMLDHLERLGYSSVDGLDALLGHYRTEVTGSTARRAVVADLPPNDADDLAWQRVLAEVPQLETACVATLTPEERFRPDDWGAVEQAAAWLRSGLPCGEVLGANQSLAPVREAVIVNAAWVVRLDGFGRLRDVVHPAVAARTSRVSAVLDDLVLKSFEIAEVRRRTPWP
jgi:hypothetical protein